MNLQVIKNRLLKWLKRILFYGTYSTILVVLLAFLALQLEVVQEKLLSIYSSRFSKVSGFKVQYDDFYLWWYDRLELDGFKVIDPENNTMIGAGKLTINFRFSSLLQNNDVNIDGVSLMGGTVNLSKIHETDSVRDLNINVFIQRINEMFKSGNGGGKAAHVNIGEIAINDSDFIFNDSEKDSIPVGFDYNHFKLRLEEAELENFKVVGDSTLMNILSFSATDHKTGLVVKELSTYFLVCQKSMEFLNLNLKAGKSILGDTIILKYQSLADLSNFNEKVNIQAKLRDCKIHPDDIALFTNGTSPFPEELFFEGILNGKVNRFSIQHMEAALGKTSIRGKLSMDGLPSINETFIDLDIKSGTVIVSDLQFLFPSNIYKRIEPFDRFKVKGQFTGFINDFVADGEFDGKLGFVKSDINLKVNETQIEESTFSGGLNLVDFDLGAYFNDTINFQKVTLTGKIKGKGLTEKTTDFFLSGQIKSIGIRNYDYANITTNARFASQLFSGNILINDPNLKFRGDGSLDLRTGSETVKLNARLDTAYIHNLGFISNYFAISSDIKINTRGLKLDELAGDIILGDTDFKYVNQSLHLDSVHVLSQVKETKRIFNIRSSLADMKVEGDFHYSSLLNDFNRLFKEFVLNIRNDKLELARYYSEKKDNQKEYKTKFRIDLHNVNPILTLAGIDMSISPKTKIEGDFTSGYTSILNAFSSVDTIRYEGKEFYRNELELSGSKISDSTHVLAVVTVNSESQKISDNFKTNNLFTEAVWNSDHIDLTLDVDQQGRNNYLRLQSEIDFLADSTKIKILPTRLKVLEKEWVVNQKNYALVRGPEWDIHHLEIHHDQESILIEGKLSRQKEPLLNVNLQNFDLALLNSLSPEKIEGIANGKVRIRDVYKNPYIQNDISVRGLTVNDFLIGDILGSNSWNQEDKRFDINLSIDRLGQRTMSLEGHYDPDEEESPLFIKAKLEKTSIKVAEPFLKGVFSEMDGLLSGQYTIKGTFSKPLINGDGKIEAGKLTVDYLKTHYTFSGSLGFTPNQIIFKDVDLTDALKNKASLDGYLIHKNFSMFRINLDATFRNFQMLNTTSRDNDLFYGQAYGTGKLNMFGPLLNMKISATARTEKNTRIFIPISGNQTVEKKDFITFFTSKDSIQQIADKGKKKAKNDSDPSGLTMDLNLDITPDAYAEIIFDIKAGDIIRGYGNGDIKLQLNTNGEFNMFGLYEFERGNYNFTLYDVINKEFSINKGSRISWYGDPYAGVLNLTASYRQLASLVPILQDSQTESVLKSPQIKRKYPVEVQLKLDGPMLSPQINFDITSKDLPDNVIADGTPVRLNFYFNAFKAKLDEQELKKQVFSLIVLRRFSVDTFTANGALTNSVSEFLSNQLSYWLTQVDQNLEIDLDLGKLDQEAFNTFQLRLSYSFLNGRLRVTRDGTFSNQYNRSDVANMLGDWTVDYLLTPDGKFKVKMYNRTNLNQLSNTLGAQSTITTGVSLLHTQNFNKWRDLIISARERRRRELQNRQGEENEEDKDGTN